MNKVKIITDSCGDLSSEQLEKYGVAYARMKTVEDGVEAPALLTWSKEDAKKLYDTIRGGKRILTTQVPVEEFENVFGKYLEEGYDIVYIACSSKQSGSVNTAFVTSKKLLEKYPDQKIFCIDSLNATIGEGILAIKAAEMANAGKDSQKINDYIMSVRNNVIEYATVHTLDHLKKAGRVKATAAFFGNLMGVKPILISDANGEQTPIKKVKGRLTSFKEMVKLLKENIVDPENQTVYIAHADCSDEEIEMFKNMIKAEVNCKDISVGYIGPIVGASIGPDAIGVWAMGKTVTFEAKVK